LRGGAHDVHRPLVRLFDFGLPLGLGMGEQVLRADKKNQRPGCDAAGRAQVEALDVVGQMAVRHQEKPAGKAHQANAQHPNRRPPALF
jgi:hypothetical protein